jgi:hypothetical protein
MRSNLSLMICHFGRYTNKSTSTRNYFGCTISLLVGAISGASLGRQPTNTLGSRKGPRIGLAYIKELAKLAEGTSAKLAERYPQAPMQNGMAVSATCYYEWTERGAHSNQADKREVFLPALFGGAKIDAVPGRLPRLSPGEKSRIGNSQPNSHCNNQPHGVQGNLQACT